MKLTCSGNTCRSGSRMAQKVRRPVTVMTAPVAPPITAQPMSALPNAPAMGRTAPAPMKVPTTAKVIR